MAEDRFTFADSFTGLEHAFFTTLVQRGFGARTRLATHTQTVGEKTFVLHTVVATPAPRPTRTERGCNLGRTA
jgi:hypothetical protein